VSKPETCLNGVGRVAKAIPVTSTYLLKGAVLALEQCGHLLHDANCLYRNRSYASAVAFAAFAREELGRAKILFDLRDKVVAGRIVTLKEVMDRCADHVTKQDWAVLSTTYRSQDKSMGIGKLIDDRMRATPGSEEWKAVDKELRKVNETKLKRAKHDRHQQRMRALYVDPDDVGREWNRPHGSVGKTTAHDFLTGAANDYSGALQKLEPGLLVGHDDRLLQELREWTDRPTVPSPEWPSPNALEIGPDGPRSGNG
jgi:AbiV family abortive infection protein